MNSHYLSIAEAATYLGMSLESIDKNSIPMTSERQEGKFRAVRLLIGTMGHVQILAEDVYTALTEGEGRSERDQNTPGQFTPAKG